MTIFYETSGQFMGLYDNTTEATDLMYAGGILAALQILITAVLSFFSTACWIFSAYSGFESVWRCVERAASLLLNFLIFPPSFYLSLALYNFAQTKGAEVL